MVNMEKGKRIRPIRHQQNSLKNQKSSSTIEILFFIPKGCIAAAQEFQECLHNSLNRCVCRLSFFLAVYRSIASNKQG